MRNNKGMMTSIFISMIIITLWMTGVIGLWLNRMAYVGYNTKKV